jgi:hypothetical protein
VVDKKEKASVAKNVRLNGKWEKNGDSEEKLVNIKGTPFAVLLDQQKLYFGRHVFTADLFTYDEHGNFTERTLPLMGIETTAREARLAAERALRRYLSRTLETA